ncbi:MAG: DUF962 domain-containing protein [Rubripirellula sp.]|nr:DUF962 domain-containing protein [Rubripirellula sp.]
MTAQHSGNPIRVTLPKQGGSSGSPATASSRDQHEDEDNFKSEPQAATPSHPDAQRPIDQWLNQYSRYHQNTLNKQIHFICVPLIVISILGLLWSIPVPLQVARWGSWFNVATLTVLLTTIYYTRLAPTLAIGMLILAAVSIFILSHTEQWIGLKSWQVAIPLFTLAWVGQFIGHHIEGKRPAFANDLQFLLIGPLWILADLYRRVGIRY